MRCKLFSWHYKQEYHKFLTNSSSFMLVRYYNFIIIIILGIK
jgi:hypothetical protein